MVVEKMPPHLPKTPNPVISFSNFDLKGINQNLHDLMIISVVTGNYIARKVIVDQGRSANILLP